MQNPDKNNTIDDPDDKVLTYSEIRGWDSIVLLVTQDFKNEPLCDCELEMQTMDHILKTYTRKVSGVWEAIRAISYAVVLGLENQAI